MDEVNFSESDLYESDEFDMELAKMKQNVAYLKQTCEAHERYQTLSIKMQIADFISTVANP